MTDARQIGSSRGGYCVYIGKAKRKREIHGMFRCTECIGTIIYAGLRMLQLPQKVVTTDQD